MISNVSIQLHGLVQLLSAEIFFSLSLSLSFSLSLSLSLCLSLCLYGSLSLSACNRNFEHCGILMKHDSTVARLLKKKKSKYYFYRRNPTLWNVENLSVVRFIYMKKKKIRITIRIWKRFLEKTMHLIKFDKSGPRCEIHKFLLNLYQQLYGEILLSIGFWRATFIHATACILHALWPMGNINRRETDCL